MGPIRRTLSKKVILIELKIRGGHSERIGPLCGEYVIHTRKVTTTLESTDLAVSELQFFFKFKKRLVLLSRVGRR